MIMNYFKELNKKHDITNTLIDDEFVSVEFEIDKDYIGKINYQISKNDMNVYLISKKGGSSSEVFDYGQPLQKDDVFEAVDFAFSFLKDNI